MPPTCVRGVEEAVQRILMAQRDLSQWLLAIAGGSCSGKTYLARRLEEAACGAVILPLDNYFRDRDELNFPRDAQGRKTWDVPDAYRARLFANHAQMLGRGEKVLLPAYDMPTNRVLSGGTLIGPARLTVAEGLFAIRFLASFPRMLRVFVEADEHICLERRIARDALRYGVTPEAVKARFYAHVLPGYEQFVLPQREYADIIVNSSEGGA